jgi:hypothetical protein
MSYEKEVGSQMLLFCPNGHRRSSMLRKTIIAVSLSVGLWILTGGVCFGQIKSGTITGRVTDSSGAVVPGAKVSVVETATNVATDTITTSTGDYTVPALPPGIYNVVVTKQGFATYRRTGVVIGQTVTVAVDAQLDRKSVV